MKQVVLALFAACSLTPAAAIPPLVCASGGPVATIDLRVASSSSHNAGLLPLRTINRIEEGDTIHYRPLLRAREQRKGDVTLVLVPADKKKAGKDLLIFDARAADKPQQWTAPWRVSLVAFVYGPSGLSVKKVQTFLNRDDEVVGELADYAETTAKTEALIAALSSPDSSSQNVNAALAGFSSQFGVSAQLAKGTPLDQQAMLMFQSFNPRMAVYDPLAGQGPQPVGQTAGLATIAAEMFFGSPVGLAAGGTAMLMNLGAIAFPRSEFRSAFSQALPDDGVGLCGKTGAGAVHTRVEYLWALRVPNSAPPHITVAASNSLPSSVKSPLPLSASEADWKFLNRARNWKLEPDNGTAIPVTVSVLANVKSLELDIGRNVKPGRYSLKAGWDWDTFDAAGFFEVRPLADFASAKLSASTHDRVVADTGKVVLTLEDSDFEFVTKVEIKKLHDEFAAAANVPFILPKGLRKGAQDRIDVQLNTSGLEPGDYDLMVSQVDGHAHNITVKVLPAMPVVENLPLNVNQDVRTANLRLRGKHLDLLRQLDCAHASVTLGPASADGTSRDVTIQLPPAAAPGTAISMRARVADRDQPMTLGDAIRVVGPRPSITDLTISQVPAQSVQLSSGELPDGQVVSAMIRGTHFPLGTGVKLECEQRGGSGNAAPKVKRLTADQLFLTFNTGAWFNGCVVDATVTSADGDSEPRRVARIVEVPAIEQFNLDDGGTGELDVTLVGRNLETIGKAGWTAEEEAPVSQLPQPISADGRQKLQIRVPAPPSADAVLYLSLRGDSTGRPTTLHAN